MKGETMKTIYLIFLCSMFSSVLFANGESITFLANEYSDGKQTSYSYRIEIYVGDNYDKGIDWNLEVIVFITDEDRKNTVVKGLKHENSKKQDKYWKVLDIIKWSYQKSFECVYSPDRFTEFKLIALKEDGVWKVQCKGKEVDSTNRPKKVELKQVGDLQLKYNKIAPQIQE